MQSHDRRIIQWLDEIENGRVRLPVFQRGFVWGARESELLFESILKDMPAGAALILKVNAQQEIFSSQAIETAPDLKENVLEQLLDGQQRLTVIYQCLNNKFNGRKFFIEIPELNIKIDPKDIVLSVRSIPNGPNARAKQWLDDPQKEFEKKLIPLNLFKVGFEVSQEFDSWISKSLDPKDTQNLPEIIWLSKLRNFIGTIIADFNIPTLSLNANTDPSAALDVFIRMNTSGVQLREYDIVLAQLFHRTGQDLDDKLEELKEVYPESCDYLDLKKAVLPTISLLGKINHDKLGVSKRIPYPPAKSTYLQKDFSELFENNWNLFEAGISPTISLLREMKIFREASIPTEVVIPVSIAIFGKYGSTGDNAGKIRTVLKAYLWRSFLSQRYDRSTQSKVLQDFRRICSYLDGSSNRPTEIFEGPDWILPSENDIAAVKWPRSTNRLSKGILSVINAAGAKDFASGRPLADGNIFERELHHIFPKKFLDDKKLGDPNLIINCAFIEKKTNRIIGKKSPSEYFQNREDFSDNSSEINERFGSHLIPVPELLSNNYDDFKSKRANIIWKQIMGLCHEDIESYKDESPEYLGAEIDLIYSGENELVEFKSSARWDYKKNQINKDLSKPILKTIAGFSNTRGGTLFIGVDDDQNIVGINADKKAFNVENTDKYELKIQNIFISKLGVEKTSEIISSIKFIKRHDKEICVIRVVRSPSGTYVNDIDKSGAKVEKFYIRSSNQTIPLKPSEEHNYRKRMGLR
jgi:uncharacterized protein with ParB-like and HNH nuclease domain